MALSTPVIPTNGEGSSGTDASSYVTGSVAFANSKLYLLAVCNGLVGTPSTPTVTGGGLTWVQIDTTTRNNNRVTVFRALKTSGASTGTLTIDFAGTTQSNCLWQVTEWTGMPTTGTNGSDAVTQYASANQAGTNASVTLPNAVTTDGATFGAVFVNSASFTATAGTGFTELGTTATSTSPSIRRSTEYAQPGIRTVYMTIGGTTNNWGIVACEVVNGPSTQTITQNTGGIASAETFYSPTVTVAGAPIAIAYRDAQQAAQNSGNGILDVTKPVGLQIGDFMLGVIAVEADKLIKSVPSGFQLYATTPTASATLTNAGIRGYLYWKMADANDVAASTFRWVADTGADFAIGLLAYSGVSSANPFDVVKVTPDESTTSTACVAPSVTTTVTGDYLLVVSMLNPQLASGTASFSTPGGFSERVDISAPFVTSAHVRAAISVNEKPLLTTPTASGTTTVTPSAAGKNLAYSILLVAGSQTVTGAQGPPQFIDMNADQIVTAQSATTITGCMAGWYEADRTIAADEAVLTKRFPCIRVYQQTSNFGKVPGSVATLTNQDRLVVVSHKAPYGGTSLQNTSWQRIQNGNEDTSLIALARAYKGIAGDVVFVFHHEPHDNCITTKPSSATTSAQKPYGDNFGTASEYIGAWRQIYNIFVQEGAHASVGGNVYFGYCAVANFWADKEDKGIGTTLYPTQSGGADTLVQCLAHDDYNWYHAEKWKTQNGQLVHYADESQAWEWFSYTWLPIIQQCDRRQKPLIIGEWGSDHGRGASDPNKIDPATGHAPRAETRNEWFKEASEWIQSNSLAKKWLIGMCYFHSPEPTVNWQFTAHDPSNDGIDGWKAGFVRSTTGVAQDYFMTAPHAIAPNGVSGPPGGGNNPVGFGIPSEETFYRATVAFTSGDQTISAEFIPSEEDFGYHNVAVVGGAQGITFPDGGIRSEETFYRATIYIADRPAVVIPVVHSRAAALEAIMSTSTQVIRRVEIYEQDGTTPFFMPAPCMGGTISIDMFRDERRTMDLVLDNSTTQLNDYPGGFWYDKIIKVYRGVEYGGLTYGVPPDPTQDGLLGIFMIDSIESQNFPHAIHVTGRDYTKKLMVSKFKYTTSFKPGRFIPDVIRDIAVDGGILSEQQKLYRPSPIPPEFLLAATSSTATDQDTTFDRGSSRWDAIKLLAGACNCSIYFDRFGFLVLEPFADPYLQAPAFIFSAQQQWGDPNLITYKRRVNDGRLFNVVIALGGKAGDAVSPYGIRSNTAAGSPTSVDEIGERVAEPIYNSLWTTNAMCEAAANSWLKIVANEEFTINFESVVVPWLDVNTVVEFVNPTNGSDPRSFLLAALTIPLSLNSMSSEARRVARVEDTNVVVVP